MKTLVFTTRKMEQTKFSDATFCNNIDELPLLYDYDLFLFEVGSHKAPSSEVIQELDSAVSAGLKVVLFLSRESNANELINLLGLKFEMTRISGEEFSYSQGVDASPFLEYFKQYDYIFRKTPGWQSIAYSKKAEKMISGIKKVKAGSYSVFPLAIELNSGLLELIKKSLKIDGDKSTYSFKSAVMALVIPIVFVFFASFVVKVLRLDQIKKNNQISNGDWLNAREVGVRFYDVKSHTVAGLLRGRLSVDESNKLSLNYSAGTRKLNILQELGNREEFKTTIYESARYSPEETAEWLYFYSFRLLNEGRVHLARDAAIKAYAIHLKHQLSDQLGQKVIHLYELLKYNFLASKENINWSFMIERKSFRFFRLNFDSSLRDNASYHMTALMFPLCREPCSKNETKSRWLSFIDNFENSEKIDEAHYNVIIQEIFTGKLEEAFNRIIKFKAAYPDSYLVDDSLQILKRLSIEVAPDICIKADKMLYDVVNKNDKSFVRSEAEIIEEQKFCKEGWS
ncbi:hypothetical protein FLL45_19785 [Aliikangiella marina]|uniref:Uncharacterized protein n=1 Tax=Aliikangiella marina TaxID=1712262 RepID=A0A545T2G9_9GAMM|nr:hypothetical protein [Aliikangiella marina]TQV71399.1 hypothetical protein FLL45_19785 [Aliikangiella marina]